MEYLTGYWICVYVFLLPLASPPFQPCLSLCANLIPFYWRIEENDRKQLKLTPNQLDNCWTTGIVPSAPIRSLRSLFVLGFMTLSELINVTRVVELRSVRCAYMFACMLTGTEQLWLVTTWSRSPLADKAQPPR